MKAADWLRRTVQRTIDRSAHEDGPHTAGDSSLIHLLDEAQKAHQSAAEGAERALDAAARQKSSLQSAAAEMRVFIGRQRDIGASASRVGEALERARLVALNAGLEGVRMSEPAGRAVAMVSDEVRQAVQRGIDALDDHRKLLDKLDEQQKKLQEQVRATETGACDLKQLLDQTRELQDKSSHILTELFDKAQEATGADKQTLRWMAEVGTRAQELLRLLAQAPGGAALQWSLDALRPALRALERRLSDLQADGEATGESSGNDS